jgi:hypothetical protein
MAEASGFGLFVTWIWLTIPVGQLCFLRKKMHPCKI